MDGNARGKDHNVHHAICRARNTELPVGIFRIVHHRFASIRVPADGELGFPTLFRYFPSLLKSFSPSFTIPFFRFFVPPARY